MRNMVIFLFLAPCVAHADKWPLPEIQGASSPNGSYVVRVIPRDQGNKLPPLAMVYHFDGRSYSELKTFTLRNAVSPVDILISDNGHIITFDNWHEMGYGEVVSIYESDGRVIATYTLADLYTNDQLSKLEEFKSVSSIRWRCEGAQPWINVDSVPVNDSIGGLLVFNESDGKYNHRDDGHCRNGG